MPVGILAQSLVYWLLRSTSAETGQVAREAEIMAGEIFCMRHAYRDGNIRHAGECMRSLREEAAAWPACIPAVPDRGRL
jgi:hypothetical protein